MHAGSPVAASSARSATYRQLKVPLTPGGHVPARLKLAFDAEVRRLYAARCTRDVGDENFMGRVGA